MKNTVIITETAANDIEAQFQYIAFIKQSPLNAERWLQQLHDVFTQLEDFAGYGRAPDSDFVGVELRQRIYKSHRIIYELIEKRSEVIIHYVRHGAQKNVDEE